MPIIQEVTEKKFLTEEEKTNLKNIQTKTESLIAELGEISMIKIQIENRYETCKIIFNRSIKPRKRIY
jgi:hypothetical protein